MPRSPGDSLVSRLYERLARPLLFRMDPEKAHETATRVLGWVQRLPRSRECLEKFFKKPPQSLETRILGLSFPNPIGLAAGFDKDCLLADILPGFGFGFLELGSVTLRPQAGNPKPRLFRLPEQKALINRLGFNNAGAREAASRLSRLKSRPIPIGINLGLNADCPKERAPQEYAELFEILEPYGDYFAVNVSSPNTSGLRDLQERLHLEKILLSIQMRNKSSKPVLVKISPDLSEESLPDLVSLIGRSAAGVIAANTTVSREGLALGSEIRGGLSGPPLRARSTALISRIYSLSEGRLPIIGSGGISNGADALEKIRAGASLVQIYTGFVYGGPGSICRVGAELAELLVNYGFRRAADAVGSAHREAAV